MVPEIMTMAPCVCSVWDGLVEHGNCRRYADTAVFHIACVASPGRPVY